MMRLLRQGALGETGRSPFAQLADAARQQDLDDGILVFAEELILLDAWHTSPDDQLALGALTLGLLLAESQGSTCVTVGKQGSLRPILADLLDEANVRLSHAALLRRIDAIVAESHLSSLIGAPGQRRPLIREGDAVYTQKTFAREQRVATALRHRLRATSVATVTSKELGDPTATALSPGQAAAVDMACARPLTVIAGGPGTGKTTVIRAITTALNASGHARIGHAAPTGKAAHRLNEALGIQAATTLHRLLGARRYHSDPAPLPLDALIIDESSMIPLGLLDETLRCLDPATKLILVGDPMQLPAVGAGQVFWDIDASLRSHPARVELTETFRQSHAADVASLRQVMQILRDGGPLPLARYRARPEELTWAGFAWVDSSDESDVQKAVRAFVGPMVSDPRFELVASARTVPTDADLAAALTALATRRVITVTRQHAGGSADWSAWLHKLVLSNAPDLTPGDPVLMIENDRDFGLANGDSGIVFLANGERWVAFAEGATIRRIPLAAIRRRLELAWATTVHKSQGTETDHVLLLMPTRDGPLATRPLLYTAITRARKSATVVGNGDIIKACMHRIPNRQSRLGARLL